MQLTVIKIGGNVIDNPRLYQQFLSDFAQVPSPKILIHGGGKIATQVAVKLDIETVMVEGRRITDEKMLEVVTMVYGGLVNKRLVAQLQALGCNAIGLTGADAGVIRSHKRAVGTIDYGFVGDIEAVNATFIKHLLEQGITPIFAPLTYDMVGNMLNTNADTQAQAVAVALSAHYDVTLTYCFEKKGVLSNPDDDEAVIPNLNPTSYDEYKTSGVINKGMIPKLDNAFKALQQGVNQVVICHAEDLGKVQKGTIIRL
ncbi:MAG: acetylglutamate kinase [Spirosomataceae bacterium]